jgi:hypothetical protein
MGDLLQTLGGAFGVGSQQSQSGPNPLDMILGQNGFAGPMSEKVMGFPSVPLGNSPMPQEAGMGPTPQEEAVAVKGWKPKERSLLGILADAYLQSQGMAPAYKQRIETKNMQNAMEGFTNDPLESVRRMAQIPGMQEKAWTLYNQIIDNKRADGTLERQNRALDMRNDDYIYQMTAGMMGAANEGTWSKMRDLAIQRAQSRGVDVSHLIPEMYDADSVKFMQYGAVKPKDQMVLEERRENNQARVGIQRDRLGETQRHNQVSEGQQAANEAGRAARHSTPRPRAQKPSAAQSILPDGSRIVYGGGDKQSAQTAIVIGADGTKRYLNKLPNGQWKVVAPPTK